MTELPRVTYSNAGSDFTPVHTRLDAELDSVSEMLGRSWANIVGAERNDADGKPFTVQSPIDNTISIGSFVAASPDSVDRAVKAAAAAFPAWSALPWQDRVAALRRVRAHLERRKFTLAVAALIEIGKSRLEAMGEAEEALDLIEYYASELERHDGYAQSLRQVLAGEETRSVMRPLGVFAVISPFNFPIALAVNMVAGAVITGNTVVFKPSPGCGLTGRLIAEAFVEAGLPDGVVNFVAGGDDVGRSIVDHPAIAGVAFTGSHDAGMSIFRALSSGRYAKPVIAEMGGKNPAYVTASADLQAAAEGVARSAFGLQGQKCSACSVVYVDASIKDAFVKKLVAFAEKIEIGDPRKQSVFMGPIYGEKAAERFIRAVAEAKEAGKIVYGGQRLHGPLNDRGYYLQPTIVELTSEHRLTREELFLPFVTVRTFNNLEDGIAEGNRVDYGLSAGIYTKTDAEMETFLNSAQAGVLYANRPSGATTGAWPGVQSFCGWKGSGVSHKGGLGPHYLPQFLREQSHTLLR